MGPSEASTTGCACGTLPSMCAVLRCNRPGSQLIDYVNDPEAPAFEAPICDEHMRLIEGGAPWRWDDDERVILMGDDLDSGGALVIGDWQFVESLGDSELILNCSTPSGQPHEPLRFIMSRDDLRT